uniref:Copper ion-binding protein n=1 Tax=uncultured bacterium pES01019D12 TaxID=355333 RepID=A0EJL6_9BACT|nr:copper ion-binding protein [uncultured bacterium pES01019D12]
MECKDSPYRLDIENMRCMRCVASVEKVVSTVTGVTTVEVNLADAWADISGGAPHEVIDALNEAGYPARPQPGTPDSCPIPATTEPGNDGDETPLPGNGGAYQLQINDMTCAACVANVEKAIFAVPGVTAAAVNLIEKKAWVTGGDPTTGCQCHCRSGL